MDENLKTVLWHQFGAAIDTLENAITACPDEKWCDPSDPHLYWNLASHTLFWLDYYLSDTFEGFTPPPPFTLVEMDPAGVLPDRPYTKEELLSYLAHGRRKCRARIASLTEASAAEVRKFGRYEMTTLELLLYNMRHVQHHAAQMNLLLRQRIDSAPRWVGRTRHELAAPAETR
jgi:hypothetical protein